MAKPTILMTISFSASRKPSIGFALSVGICVSAAPNTNAKKMMPSRSRSTADLTGFPRDDVDERVDAEVLLRRNLDAARRVTGVGLQQAFARRRVELLARPDDGDRNQAQGRRQCRGEQEERNGLGADAPDATQVSRARLRLTRDAKTSGDND